MDELGFIWDPREADWEEGFSYLKIYKDRVGDCRVPQRYKENGFHLGRWASVQRVNKDKMSSERRRRLDELGFVWDILETDWEDGLNCLKAYKKREGHCNVPKSHKESEFSLGLWVCEQRVNKEKMSSTRRQRLDGLGFVWDAREGAWENGFSRDGAHGPGDQHSVAGCCHSRAGQFVDGLVGQVISPHGSALANCGG